ncbi:transketolase [Cutibacterium acnes JCM 18920]|nr:transketolase [Cutibacterium acnes JCM 18920]
MEAIDNAKAVTDKPSFIRLTTVIGWPIPKLAGLAQVHGAKIGTEGVSALKEKLGFEDKPFAIDLEMVQQVRAAFAERGKGLREVWDEKFAAWHDANPDGAALLERMLAHKLPDDLDIPTFEPGKMSTRKASGAVLSALGPQLPELWGGSADLAGSNNTTMKGADSFLPEDRCSEKDPGSPYGRTIHFGVREHAMGGILNGITLSGLTRCYGGTFFVFSDYMRPSARLAALMKVPSIFVWTHDSIASVKMDYPPAGRAPTSYRAIPGLDIVRPADANETAVAWRTIVEHTDRPAGLVLSRQDLPTIDRSEYASAEGVAKGAYVVCEASAEPKVILIGTGSELSVALEAREKLEADGIPTRVVSMPCQEWFDEQDEEYRESVLPSSVTARVSVEAGIAMGWAKYVGCKGASVSLEHFGASASGALLFEKFGFTADHVAEVAHTVL